MGCSCITNNKAEDDLNADEYRNFCKYINLI